MIVTEDYTLNHCNRIMKYIHNMLNIIHSYSICSSIQIVVYISEDGTKSIKDYSELMNNMNKLLNNLSIPLVYAVVPKLPKLAPIQIECINMMSWVYEQLPPTYVSKNVNFENGCNCSINGVYNSKSYLSLRINVSASPNTVLDFENVILKDVIGVVDDVVKESEYSLDNIMSIRYYYLHDVIDGIFIKCMIFMLYFIFIVLPHPYNSGIGISTNYIPDILPNITFMSMTLCSYNKKIIDKHILV